MKLLLTVPQAAAEPVPKAEPKVSENLLARTVRLLASALHASVLQLPLSEVVWYEAVVMSL